MIGRPYSVIFENVTITNSGGDQDLFELTPAAQKPVIITGLTLDNVGGTADVGEAQEEMLRLAIIRGHATSGSGGSAPTPQPLLSSGAAAAGFTAEVNNTTIASAGTGVTLAALGWNVRIPLREFWPEEICLGASLTNTLLVVRLLSTVADDIAVSGTLYVVEMG